MIGVATHLKSFVRRATAEGRAATGMPWYIRTPQRDHLWAQTWDDAMQIANQAAREAQIEALR